MANTAELTYTSESKGFEYKDGDYNLCGSKIIRDGQMSAIDGGIVRKANGFIGTFFVRVEDGDPKISLNNVSPGEIVKVTALVKSLLTALAE